MSYVTTTTSVPNEHLPSWMKKERTRILTSKDLTPNAEGQSVVYWMQRDVRTADNWALLFAAHLAETQKVPLHVFHVLPPPPTTTTTLEQDDLPPGLADLPMTERHGKFLLGGLELVHAELEQREVSMHVLKPLSHRLVPNTIQSQILEELQHRIFRLPGEDGMGRASARERLVLSSLLPGGGG